ncbi:MAG: VanW family protein [Actinomycetota bacterium]|nr:VanW family protein [Actinomycetota bacterium]
MSLKKPRRNRISFRDDLNARGGSPDKRLGSSRRRIVGPVIVICAVLAMLVAADYWMNQGRIYRGVEVGGVDLSGKTPEEARALLEEHSNDALQEIRFTGEAGEFTLTAGEMDLDFDVAGTVDRAYAVGREGSVLKSLGDRIEAPWTTERVSPVVDYDREATRAKIENLAKRVNQEPQDAYVAVRGSQAEAVESREGYVVDVEATAANVDGALESMSGEAEIVGETRTPGVLTPAAQAAAERAQTAMSGPVTLASGGKQWKLPPEETGQTLSLTPQGGEILVGLDREQLRESLSDMYDELNVEPVEAGFELNGDNVSVTESRTGKEIEEEKLFGSLESGLFEGIREYEVPVITAEPQLTTEEAQELKPTNLIGSYRTDYRMTSDQSEDRVENLKIASNAISGRALAPGEIFSVNEVVAPLDYNKTKVIIEGKEEKADGGGLCQVSSTLYMAANYAGLEIVERHPHYAQLPYIRPGMDATVWFGSLDMKFKNTTEGYILTRETVREDGYIYAEIWGQPTGKKVEMDSEPEYLGPDYSKWITYQKVTEDGEVVQDGELHTDVYKPLTDEKGKVIRPDSEEAKPAPVNY